MDHRTQLIEVIKKLSYREGDFLLVSGQKSKYYIDLKATTLHPVGARLIGLTAVDLLVKHCFDCEAIGGLTLGADPIATSISLIALEKGHHLPAFIVRKEPKKHGTQQFIEGTENIRDGARLVVVEDVVTTGASSIKAVERVRAEGYHCDTVLTIVDRRSASERSQNHFEKVGLKLISILTIEDLQA